MILKSNKKIIITGPSGSGKSSLKNKLISKGFKPITQFTNRIIRSGETDGIDYKFIDTEKINELMVITSHTYGNGTTYGIEAQEWVSGQVAAIGMRELIGIDKDLLRSCLVIYLDIPLKELYKNLDDREDRDTEVKRRLQADKQDYADFDLWDIRIASLEDFKI